MTQLFSWFQFSLNILGLALLALIVLMMIFVILVPVVLRNKKKMGEDVKIRIKKMNDVYEKQKNNLLEAVLSPKEKKRFLKEKKAQEKIDAAKNDEDTAQKKRVFVLDFKGDIAASQVTYLREQVTSLLQVVNPQDEIVVRLESPGGVVHGYGLAASQLARIREKNIPLTVCVDKVAASGGYMMACLANKILSSPFAIIGSIGVVSTIPNFNKLLKKHDVDFYEMTAGKYKRTLTLFGEATPEKIEKSNEKIQEVHVLFKQHVKQYRDVVDIETISTGEYWFGHQALELKLVDHIQTSDDYLLDLSKTHDLYSVYSPQAHSLRDKLFSGFSNLWHTLLNR